VRALAPRQRRAADDRSASGRGSTATIAATIALRNRRNPKFVFPWACPRGEDERAARGGL